MVTKSGDGIPTPDLMLWPVVLVIRELGGSGTNEEIDRDLIAKMGFTEEQQSITTVGDRHVKINHRVAWARTSLKNIGYLVNSARAVWSLTPTGLTVTEDEVTEAFRSWRTGLKTEREAKRGDQAPSEAGVDEIFEESDAEAGEKWKADLLALITGLSPSGFERLCQRLLREAGFRDVRVVGQSGDNGIDIVGTFKISLISFQTYVQCKRYAISRSVGNGDVRNFRGAMAGKGSQGLFITTSRFTRDAEIEANRDGVEPIDLIDGNELCQLMRDHGLGTTVEMVEQVSVNDEFFQAFAEN